MKECLHCIWASVSEPHTSVFNGEFVCAYGVRTYVRCTYVRTYAHTAYRFAFQYNVSNSFCNIPNCSRGHCGCSAASLGMLSQSRRQRQRLQCCRIYSQVGDKSHWNSRERVLEPEELSFLQTTDSDIETREGAKRATEGASPLTYAWANTSLTLAPQCLAFT